MRLRSPKSCCSETRVDDGAGEQVRRPAACPSRSRPPARRRAARRRPGAPRAAGRAGSRRRGRQARRRRSARRPRSARGGSLGARDHLGRRRTAAGSRTGASSPFGAPDELGQLRDDLVHVADDAEVAELEDRRVRVLVDGDDRRRAPACRPCAGSRRRCRRRCRASARRSCRSGRPAPGTGTSPRRRPRASRRRRRRAPSRAPRASRSPPACRGRGRRRRSRRRPRSTARSRSSCACSSITRAGRVLLQLDGDVLDLGAAARRRRVERAGAEERDPRLRRPADVDERRSPRARAACRRASPSSSAMSVRSQLRPASSRAASPAATSAASTDWPKRTVSKPLLRDERREHVDARLRQRRLERRIVGDVDGRGAVLARLRRELADARAGDHARRRRRRARPPSRARRARLLRARRSWCSRKTRSLITDSFLSARKSTIFCGGGAVVLDRAASRRAGAAAGGRAPRCASPASPARPAVDAEVGERERLLRLRLRAHDPLQRRVARLVDRVRDGDDGRQRRLDHVVAELGLPLHRAPCRRRRSSSAACETSGRCRRSATAAQSTAPSESDACWPKRTRSGCSRSSAAAST